VPRIPSALDQAAIADPASLAYVQRSTDILSACQRPASDRDTGPAALSA